MSYRQEETLVSRAALRDAIRDDLDVALAARKVIADPSFDGAPVWTEPMILEALGETFGVVLPPPDEKHAEVRTTATITVHAICPECGISARTIVYLSSQLVADSAGAELRVKATSKARTHVHGQEELPEDPVAQVTIDDLLEGQAEADAPSETVAQNPLDVDPEETCPYPGCARAVDHRGLHRDAEGNKLTSLDIEPKEDPS